MLCDILVVHLQWVLEIEGSHIEHVFCWRPHTDKLSMKVSFHSCIRCFCTLECYKYAVHQNCCMFFWIPCIIFLSMPISSEWSLPFRFSNQNFVYISHLSLACYIPPLSHPLWLHHLDNIWWRIQAVKLLIMHSYPASCHFLIGTNVLLSTLFSAPTHKVYCLICTFTLS